MPVSKLCRLIFRKPVQRILPAGDHFYHTAFLVQNGPFCFQVILKISHFPVALHIDGVDFL